MTTGYPDYASRVGTQGGLRNVSPTHGFNTDNDNAVPIRVNQDGSLFVVASSKKTIATVKKIIPFNINNAGDVSVIINHENNVPRSKGTTISATETKVTTNIINTNTPGIYLRIKNAGANDCNIMLSNDTPSTGLWGTNKALLESGGEIIIQGVKDVLSSIFYLTHQCAAGETATIECFALTESAVYTPTTNPDAENDAEGDKAASWE